MEDLGIAKAREFEKDLADVFISDPIGFLDEKSPVLSQLRAMAKDYRAYLMFLLEWRKDIIPKDDKLLQKEFKSTKTSDKKALLAWKMKNSPESQYYFNP